MDICAQLQARTGVRSGSRQGISPLDLLLRSGQRIRAKRLEGLLRLRSQCDLVDAWREMTRGATNGHFGRLKSCSSDYRTRHLLTPTLSRFSGSDRAS